MRTPEKLTTFTINDIRSWAPCYDPSKHLPEDWSGTAIDLLKIESVPAADKLWVVCREELIPAEQLRLFAVWCAKQVQHLITDERSIRALEVAERFATGKASLEELNTARAAAWAADGAAAKATAWAAARAAAKATAGDAARAAAENAARAAAEDAARDAAWAGAWAAAQAAAEAAARDAARDAARAAAEAAARDTQISQLVEMLEVKNENT